MTGEPHEIIKKSSELVRKHSKAIRKAREQYEKAIRAAMEDRVSPEALY